MTYGCPFVLSSDQFLEKCSWKKCEFSIITFVLFIKFFVGLLFNNNCKSSKLTLDRNFYQPSIG